MCIFILALSRFLNLVHGVEMPPNQYRYCTLLVMFVYASVQCSTYFIVAMSFERFYSIIRPHKAASFNTVKKARIIIMSIIVFSFSYYSPYLFIGANDGRNCIPNRFASDNVYGKLYFWTSEIVDFILPFLSLVKMNSVITHTLRQRSKLNFMRSEEQGKNDDRNSKNRNSEKQVYSILFLVTFGYFILTFPGKALRFYLTFYKGHSAKYYAGLHLLDQAGGKLYYTNHGINFFLYVMSGQKFRTDLKNMFLSKKKAKELLKDINTVSSAVND